MGRYPTNVIHDEVAVALGVMSVYDEIEPLGLKDQEIDENKLIARVIGRYFHPKVLEQIALSEHGRYKNKLKNQAREQIELLISKGYLYRKGDKLYSRSESWRDE